MVKINTSCNECIFAKTVNDTQIGCMHNFIERFVELGGSLSHDDGYFILESKTCPYRRYINWMPDSYEEAVSLAKKEVVPRVTVVVLHTNEADLGATLESISQANHEEKIQVVVVYRTRNRQHIQDIVLSKLPKATICSIVDEEANLLWEAFKSVGNGYMLTINSGFLFPKNALDIINYSVNVRQDKLLYIKPDNNGNMRTMMSIVAKFVKLDLIFDFEEKLQALLEEQNIQTQTIFSWGELEDAYRLSLN